MKKQPRTNPIQPALISRDDAARLLRDIRAHAARVERVVVRSSSGWIAYDQDGHGRVVLFY